MKSLKALKNRSAGARGIKASALAALGASVLLIGAMLSACGSSGETKVDAPKLDDAGAREVLTALLPDAEELTEVIWGDGLPVDDEELLESVSGAQYRPISADSAYKSEEQIKEKAETVFSKEYLVTVYAVAFGEYDGETETAETQEGDPYNEDQLGLGLRGRYYTDKQGVMYRNIALPEYDMTTEIDTDSAKVASQNGSTAVLGVGCTVRGEESSMKVYLRYDGTKWLIDGPIY